MRVCATCGTENPDQAKFCLECATPFEVRPAPTESRKTVTIVFCDLTGSTAVGERLDPEALRRVMARYFDAMRTAIERHGGTVEKFIGDAVMAVFGVPVVREDDALRAVRAASEMREALIGLNEELVRDHGATLACRIGVNTGEVVAGTGDQTIATGDAVNVAARLEQAAEPGTVLLGEATHRLVRDAVVVEPVEPLELKGKSERVRAVRLIHVIPGAAGFVRHLDAPMVGRERELTLLRGAFDRTITDRSCQLFTVLGVGGVGKSRLLAAFVDEIAGRATVLRGRCLPYGDGITFSPVVEAIARAADLDESDDRAAVWRKLRSLASDDREADRVVERIAQLLGLTGEAAADETLWAVRRLVESMAATRPVVFVIDDIQWAEPTMLDLIEYLADWSRDAPILLACMARPELLEERPGWGGGKLNATAIALEPLSIEECESLVTNLLAVDDVAPEVRARVAEAAEGHPLFAEEMIATLVEDGLLVLDGDRWVANADLSEVAVPPTISALLAARLDRLEPGERAALELASVIGQVFYVDALRALSSDGSLTDRLSSLARKQFVHSERSDVPGVEALAFRHLLIPDAAYEGIPKSTRASLHEGFADWLEAELGERIGEQQEIAGYHLERAHAFLSELGPSDGRQRTLADRAAAHLRIAGRRAFDRGDMPAAAGLLERASDLMRADDAERIDVLIDAGLAARDAGHRSRGTDLLDEAVATAGRTDQELLIARAKLIRHDRGSLMAGAGWREDEEILARRMLELAEAAGDELSMGWGWFGLGELSWNRCRAAEAEPAWKRALEHFRRAGDRRLADECFSWLQAVPILGPMPCDAALDLLRTYESDPSLSVAARSDLEGTKGWIYAMQGRVDDARRVVLDSLRTLRELGRRETACHASQSIGWVELVAGDPAEAERSMEATITELEEMGSEVGGVHWGIRALALYRLDRFDEARAAAQQVSVQFSDLSSVCLALGVEAMVLAREGALEDAELIARDAVARMDASDFPNDRADMRMSLAEVLEIAGRPGEAIDAIHEAIALYEAKGNVQQARTARARLESLTG